MKKTMFITKIDYVWFNNTPDYVQWCINETNNGEKIYDKINCMESIEQIKNKYVDHKVYKYFDGKDYIHISCTDDVIKALSPYFMSISELFESGEFIQDLKHKLEQQKYEFNNELSTQKFESIKEISKLGAKLYTAEAYHGRWWYKMFVWIENLLNQGVKE